MKKQTVKGLLMETTAAAVIAVVILGCTSLFLATTDEVAAGPAQHSSPLYSDTQYDPIYAGE